MPARGVVSDPPPSRDVYDKSEDLGGCWGEGPAWMSTTKPSFIIDVNIFQHPYKTYSLQVIVSCYGHLFFNNPFNFEYKCMFRRIYNILIEGETFIGRNIFLLLLYICLSLLIHSPE